MCVFVRSAEIEMTRFECVCVCERERESASRDSGEECHVCTKPCRPHDVSKRLPTTNVCVCVCVYMLCRNRNVKIQCACVCVRVCVCECMCMCVCVCVRERVHLKIQDRNVMCRDLKIEVECVMFQSQLANNKINMMRCSNSYTTATTQMQQHTHTQAHT